MDSILHVARANMAYISVAQPTGFLLLLQGPPGQFENVNTKPGLQYQTQPFSSCQLCVSFASLLTPKD